MYTADSRVADIIYSDFTVIPMLGRFGITLGVGDVTIDDACKAGGIDTDLYLAIVNNYMGLTDSFGATAHLDDVKSFLRLTNAYYTTAALPNIERHFRALNDRSGNAADNNLQLLWSFFMELKKEITLRAEADERNFGNAGAADGADSEPCAAAIIAGDPAADSSIEEKVEDLRTFFIVHLKGDYDQNLCMAVVTSLAVLDNDIRRTNHLRASLRRIQK